MQNPNFKVTPDTIYNELKLFNVQDGKQMRISNDNLIKIQARLSNYFRKESPLFVLAKDHFLLLRIEMDMMIKLFMIKLVLLLNYILLVIRRTYIMLLV